LPSPYTTPFMIRVRACSIRCRCHSSCRRSRFSQLGTQIWRSDSSSNNCRISCASWRSVFCLPTRFVRISAACPIHNSNCSSESSRSNQRASSLAQSPRAPSSPAPRDQGRTSPLPRGVAVAVPVTPLCCLVQHHQVYSGLARRHCHGINYSINREPCLARRAGRQTCYQPAIKTSILTRQMILLVSEGR
jgi:hypothetical protein